MKIVADLHVHTIASGHAYSTVEEIARAAAARGLAMVALTDHGPGIPGGPHAYHFGNLRILPSSLHGVELLGGVEANILEGGLLDLGEVYLRRMDIVLAGLHLQCFPPSGEAENTTALLDALQNPFVDVIVHPGNPEYPVDLERLVLAGAAAGKALEINNSSFLVRKGSADNCRLLARLVRRHGGLVTVSSDAHVACDVGEVSRALEVVLEAGIPASSVLNLSVERVRQFLARRGKKRFAARQGGK
jgi:putative hydrolase